MNDQRDESAIPPVDLTRTGWNEGRLCLDKDIGLKASYGTK